MNGQKLQLCRQKGSRYFAIIIEDWCCFSIVTSLLKNKCCHCLYVLVSSTECAL